MIVYILITSALSVVLCLVFVLFLISVHRRPSDFRIARSVIIFASPADLFRLVNTLSEWQLWSPWENLDSNLKRTYFDPPSGPGAAYSWSGNDQAGEGKITIQSVDTDRRIHINLERLRPTTANNDYTFTFDPEAGGTKVTWAMTGQNDFVGKLVAPVIDKIVGQDFEKGLATLKQVAEGIVRPRS